MCLSDLHLLTLTIRIGGIADRHNVPMSISHTHARRKRIGPLVYDDRQSYQREVQYHTTNHKDEFCSLGG